MRLVRPLVILLALTAGLAAARRAEARTPPNPYSSFNLSGINYGSMQWERDQRQGKRVWPYYNTPAGGPSRGGAASMGTAGGRGSGVGGIRTAPRRWRR